MKARDVEIGSVYTAKVSGRVVNVRITAECPYGGWYAVNELTNKTVRIRTAARLRRRVS